MSKIETFEDLIAWQKARQLTKAIYVVTRRKTFNADRSLAHQMQRASVSVMSNIAEGFDRDSPGDFHRFLGIAKGSCGELVAQLFVAFDNEHLDANEFKQLKEQAREVGRIIGGLRKSVAAKCRS